ncbi:Trk system potassium transporter TrkA [Irregularibacter muris]|uniref:Trk system potassium uptake protein TrkA n=1 Tax=Irregularibacter muris TaxID=1796619 RepID=A0AAE3HFP8_9FIRM|nr:Trk system potassium transporter TrkA [Irregularibacter muris]MCR1899755.1 Trk system potassium transporter TrkA [Irregularibacter muris]
MRAIIVGAGKLGYRLAETMLTNDIEVTIMDTDPRVIERIDNQLDVLTINASGVQIEVLKELNVHQYDLIAAVTNSDETNIIVCSLAKKMGCKNTIARIRNPEYAHEISFIKQEMGIDHIVNPEYSIANEITWYLLKRYTFYSNTFAKGKVNMIDFYVNHVPSFIGKKLSDLEDMEGLLITAISRDGEMIIPHGGTTIEEYDLLYIIGTRSKINQFIEKCNININKKVDKKHVKKAMILGGGKIGFYLARQLTKSGIIVKIIEQNKERCRYLSEKLDKALVIYGDGTDMNLLEEEDLKTMDAFIAVTGYDEENILMSIMAKQLGVEQVITKVSRPNYSRIIETLGVDVALNPINISISNILKYIRGGRVISVSLLLGEQAEVTEIIASEKLSIIGKPIEELDLPKGVIIGAIEHSGKVTIPNGKTVIHPQDRLVIFYLTAETHAIEPFFKEKKGGLIDELSNRNKGIRKFINF